MAAARVDLHGLSVEQAVARVRATLRALPPRADVRFVSGAPRRAATSASAPGCYTFAPRNTKRKARAAQAEGCTPRAV